MQPKINYLKNKVCNLTKTRSEWSCICEAPRSNPGTQQGWTCVQFCYYCYCSPTSVLPALVLHVLAASTQYQGERWEWWLGGGGDGGGGCCLVTKSDFLQCYGLYGLQPARLLCPWNFPGKNTGVVDFHT